MAPYAPMKAVLVAGPFSEPAWLFERKLDGVRAAGSTRCCSDTGMGTGCATRARFSSTGLFSTHIPPVAIAPNASSS